MRLEKQIIYVTGLPRADSALRGQLLDHHPQIYSTHHSSPLCQTLDNLSDNQFLLAWFDTTDQQLLNTHREDTNNEPIAYLLGYRFLVDSASTVCVRIAKKYDCNCNLEK